MDAMPIIATAEERRAPSDTSVLGRLAAILGRDPEEPLERLDRVNRVLAAKRRDAVGIIAELASLRAQFTGGMTSNYDHERKVLLAQLVEARREEAAEAGTKVTESALDTYAHAHRVYQDWLRQQQERRERMYALEAELAQVEADIEAAKGERELVMQALRLNEEAIRYARAEMGMG